MPAVTLLGSAATVADEKRNSIYLLLDCSTGLYLIDCGGSPSHKLALIGADLCRLRGVLLTHDHADHIYGFPVLVQTLLLLNWAGRWDHELVVWGLAETLATAATLLDALGLTDRIPINWETILPAAIGHVVLETDDLRLLTAPTRHSRPSVAVRVEAQASGRSLTYSSDTGPSENVRLLAAGTDILLHEATVWKPMSGHSTPQQAGEAAAAANAGRLVLVHLDPSLRPDALLAEATKAFGGPVEVGRDWMQFEL